jgi:hypothetical protein
MKTDLFVIFLKSSSSWKQLVHDTKHHQRHHLAVKEFGYLAKHNLIKVDNF